MNRLPHRAIIEADSSDESLLSRVRISRKVQQTDY